MKRPLLRFAALSLCGGLLATVQSQGAEATVDSVVAKHIQAMGGEAALKKVNSRIITFKMDSQAIGNAEGKILAKGPNKERTEIDIPSAGSLNEGFDGTVGWAKTPWEDLRSKSGDELAKVKRDADLHRELDIKKLYPDLALKGTEKTGEEDAYVLESKPTPTSKEKIFISTKSGLIVRQESRFEGPQGEVNLTIVPTTYKAFDGVKYPTEMKLTFSAGGQSFEFNMHVTEVKHNVDIPDDKFAKPSA